MQGFAAEKGGDELRKRRGSVLSIGGKENIREYQILNVIYEPIFKLKVVKKLVQGIFQSQLRKRAIALKHTPYLQHDALDLAPSDIRPAVYS